MIQECKNPIAKRSCLNCYSFCKLYLDNIRYFACNGKKVEIHTGNGISEFYGNMREVTGQTVGKGFWVIHKSYVVNAAYVAVYHYAYSDSDSSVQIWYTILYYKEMISLKY